eukprot:m.123923 g.123923  ORF g.123923 m.123923 type:complete len:132 (+) comp9661_c0_seq6:422-817(+)
MAGTTERGLIESSDAVLCGCTKGSRRVLEFCEQQHPMSIGHRAHSHQVLHTKGSESVLSPGVSGHIFFRARVHDHRPRWTRDEIKRIDSLNIQALQTHQVRRLLIHLPEDATGNTRLLSPIAPAQQHQRLH